MNNIKRLLFRLETLSDAKNQENVLLLILIELQYPIFRIQLCSTFSQANEFLDALEEAQLVLIILSTRGQIKLSPSLHKFTVDFSDVYDQEKRENLFNEINHNQYVYGNIIAAFYKILDDIEQGILKPLLAEVQKQLISQKIRDIFHKISVLSNFTDSNGYYEKLLKIQELLSKAVFVYDISLNGSLMVFINDCERLDDSQTRRWLFQRIKQDEYHIFD